VLLIALALQASAAPPVPGPPDENLRAALALWADRPPENWIRTRAIDGALYAAAARALADVGVFPSGGRRTARFLEFSDKLRPLLARRLPADRTELHREVAACVVDQVARALDPAEIEQVRAFMRTTAGDKFWRNSTLGYAAYDGCYAHALRFTLSASDEDYRAIGLKPPKRPDPRRDGMIVS
jgi:hypothetical protein